MNILLMPYHKQVSINTKNNAANYCSHKNVDFTASEN